MGYTPCSLLYFCFWSIWVENDFGNALVTSASPNGSRIISLRTQLSIVFFLILVGGLEHEFYVSIQLGMSSSQLTFTHIFQRGRSTTNQISSVPILGERWALREIQHGTPSGILRPLSATGDSVLNSQVGKDGKLWKWCSSFSMDLSDDIKLKSYIYR